MTGYRVVNLALLIEELGEDAAKSILSNFSCPLNPDVEFFLSKKAIEFAKQGWAQTHLVFASYKDVPVLVGYFALCNKTICVPGKSLSQTLKKRLAQFATYDSNTKAYVLSAPLIAQLGKNYYNGHDQLITGDELLDQACSKIGKIQFDLGGKFTYIECEDKPKLIDFYARNGFCKFDIRKLDRDETEMLHGEYLVQMLKYIHK